MSEHDVEHEAMFGKRAALYDLIYQWKDYGKESGRVRELLLAEGVVDGSCILEAACGTGTYMQHLGRWYDLIGFDLNEEMLDIARDKLGPTAKLFQADMVDFTVDEPLDAALCLFSSIGYVYPKQRLRAAAKCFANAVRPGGLVIIEPWVDPEDYRPGYGSMHTYDSPELKLCRAVIGRRDGDMAVMDFHWLVLQIGTEAVEHFIDQHRLWLCPREVLLGAFEQAGFDCRFEPDGLMPKRGLLIGRKR
jgi:hypothetical protein